MKKFFTLIAFAVCLFTQAQMSKQQISKELNDIYSKYDTETKAPYEKLVNEYKIRAKKLKTKSDSLSLEKEYEADYQLYLKKVQPLKIQKIQQLKNLTEKISASRPFMGKRKVSEKPQISANKKVEENMENASIQEISEIRNAFANQFDTGYFDGSEENLKANISFVVDSDGIIKQVKATGVNEEFNYHAIITLYYLDKKIAVEEKNGELNAKLYRFPVTLNFE